MLDSRPLRFIYFFSAFAAFLVLSGCESGAVATKGKKRPPGSGGEEAEVPRKAVEVKKYGTITGKVIYDGTPPTPQPVQMGANAAQCHATPPNEVENDDQQWLVDKGTKGVKNVVVFLQPPQGMFFDVPEEHRKPKADVEVTQPRCAFTPRAFVIFPSYYDQAGSEKSTGQKLVIVNDAPFEHNYNLVPGSDENRASNRILKRGESAAMDGLHPQAKPITIKCDIHAWMRCYGFILEHPYAAVTKDDGTFTIENVPLDVPVQIVCWHEAAGFTNYSEEGKRGTEEGKTLTLKDKQTLDYKVKSR